jgi:hypothetical protein
MRLGHFSAWGFCAVLLGCGGESFVTNGDGGGNDATPGDGGGGGDGGGDGATPGDSGPGPDGCAGAICGGNCVVLQTNNANCGACGHVCAMGQCAGGACPVLPNATVFGDPACLAIDATSVYFTNGRPVLNNQGGVFKVPLMGGGPVPIATMGQDTPRGIAVDQTGVYWSTNGAIWRAAINSPFNPSGIASGQPTAGAVALDASWVYWVSTSDGILWRLDKTGGSASALTQGGGAHGSNFQSLVLDAPNHMAYWTDPMVGVLRFDVDNSNPTTATQWVSGQSRALGIALSGAVLHWANNTNGTLMRGSTQSQTAVATLNGQTAIHSVATDGTNAYFSYQGGIRRTPLMGGNATHLAQAQNPTCLAVDGSFVYFMAAGQIWRTPK